MSPSIHPDDIRSVREANLPRLLGIAEAVKRTINATSSKDTRK
jgi:hypothetical protein